LFVVAHGKISERDIVHWHKIWKKISPNGTMNEKQFIRFIVDNHIGSGTEHDAKNMFKMMDQDRNGTMEFSEFVLILLLPKSAEEVSAEQFTDRVSTSPFFPCVPDPR
jgi:Ca2+-binding EF-hand superfamily protein